MTEDTLPLPPIPAEIKSGEAVGIIRLVHEMMVASENRITSAIDKGFKAHDERHSREYGEFVTVRDSVAAHHKEVDAEEERERARIEPIKRVILWAYGHGWQLVFGILGAIGWVLGIFGIDRIHGLGQ